MKKHLLLFLSAGTLYAAPFIPLPETVAYVDGIPLKAEQINTAWKKALESMPDDVSRETLDRTLAALVEETVCRRETLLMLRESGITADRVTARRYIARQLDGLPEKIREELRKDPHLQEDLPEIRLKAAIYFFLKKTVPEKIRVTDTEIENVYRSNQLRWKIPGRMILGILTLQTREQAEAARSALLQGTAFDKVAGQYSPGGSMTAPTEKMLKLAKHMHIKEVSQVLKEQDHWLVFQVRAKTPDRFLTLQEASHRIRLELASRKEADALEALLRSRLAKRNIVISKIKH